MEFRRGETERRAKRKKIKKQRGEEKINMEIKGRVQWRREEKLKIRNKKRRRE